MRRSRDRDGPRVGPASDPEVRHEAIRACPGPAPSRPRLAGAAQAIAGAPARLGRDGRARRGAAAAAPGPAGGLESRRGARAGGVGAAAAGDRRRGPRTPVAERRALGRRRRERLVPPPGGRRARADGALLASLPRSGRPVPRLPGEPGSGSHGRQRRGDPPRVRARRHGARGARARRGARDERDVGSGRKPARLLRAYADGDASLGGRARRLLAPREPPARPRHGLHGAGLVPGRTHDRHRARPPEPSADARASGGPHGPAGEAQRGGREHPPRVQEPPRDAVRRGSRGVAQHRSGGARRRRERRRRGGRCAGDGAGPGAEPGRGPPARRADGAPLQLPGAGADVRLGDGDLGP